MNAESRLLSAFKGTWSVFCTTGIKIRLNSEKKFAITRGTAKFRINDKYGEQRHGNDQEDKLEKTRVLRVGTDAKKRRIEEGGSRFGTGKLSRDC